MTMFREYLTNAILLGAGGTALMDIWGAIRQPLFGFPRLDNGLVGRWFGHMARGRFVHLSIAAAPPIHRERVIGWAMHYLIGITFAALLLGVWGLAWLRQPTPGPALTTGIVTVVGPFLLMQPGMGAGIAASRTPRPAMARIQSLITHALFGVGLYLTARLAQVIKGE